MAEPFIVPSDHLIADMVRGNDPHVRSAGRVRYFAAPRATVIAGTRDELHQLCQIQFDPAGHIFVHFPYLGETPGLLREVERGPIGMRTVDMTDGGKLVSTHVKFAHKLDGRVHFSQDGKVRTTVVRESVRLDGPLGRIFELTAFHPRGFQPLNQAKKGRVYLPFISPEGLPDALFVYAEWRRTGGIEQSFDRPDGVAGPIAGLLDRRTGIQAPRIFYGPPSPDPHHLLVVTCLPVEPPQGVSDSGMVLRGGFDPHELPPGTPPSDAQLPTGWLSFLYPVKLSGALRERVEDIDYHRPGRTTDNG